MTEVVIKENRDGEVIMTIRVTSEAEAFRFAYYMAHGPLDYMPGALRVFRYLNRRWGYPKLKEHDLRITGGTVVKRGWHRAPRIGA